MTSCIAALIRHGDYFQLPDTPSAHQPFALTEDGKTQASQAVKPILEMLERYQLAPEIYTSNMLRAWQTADILKNELEPVLATGLQLASADELAERCVGSLANLSLQQIENIVEQDPRHENLPLGWKSNSHFCLPFQGAESLLMAGQRVAEFLVSQMSTLATTMTGDSLKIFVGHGAAFRHAAYHLGVLEFEDLEKLSMFHAHPVFLEYSSDGTWSHAAGDWKIRNRRQVEID